MSFEHIIPTQQTKDKLMNHFFSKLKFYILATVGYLMMLIGTPILASNLPNKDESLFLTFSASAGVVVVFFIGAYLIGLAARNLEDNKVQEPA